MAWMKHLKTVQDGLNGVEDGADIKPARGAFEHVSNGLIAAADAFGIGGQSPVYVYHCPMAFGGKGADWLQNKQGTENPYYGSMMFACGEEVGAIDPRDTEEQERELENRERPHDH